MALLRFESVSFRYPDAETNALEALYFSIEKGEYVVVCGESGCGKTTLLRMTKSELRPVGQGEGTVYYKDKPVQQLNAEQSAFKIGFVQQNPDNQIVTDYVWHELAFGLENMALPVQDIRRRVSEMASFFGMEEWFHKKTCQLSGGQKQMLNLAAVMAMDPEVLILDEPTSMLDPLAAANLLGMVRRINRELGVAVLICEHRLEEVFQTADQILLMKRGKILWKDTPERIAEHLQQDPDSSRIYYGLPGAVRIFGELRKQGIYPEGKKLPLNIRDARNALAELRTDGQYVIRTLEKEKKDNTEQNVIEAKELWFRYEKNAPDILRSMDFQLKKGEIFTLLGGNGAGKSTFLKLAAGLLRPQRGKVKTSEGMRLAMLPQSPQALFHYDTVWEEFLESAVAGWKEEAARQKAEEMAAFLELDGKKFSHPYDLSGGEMQRAAVGKLLLQRADILLMDEPTKGLDAYLKQSLAEMLRKLADQKLSILMVTHDLEFAASYADRCGLLFDGQLISEDEPHGFFSGNRFYTTAAGLIAGDRIEKVITCGEVIAACQNAE